jgi:RNA polymerase sigma-70 factor (ECF subfamily)
VLALLPDSEVMGLLALMLLHESRRKARVDVDGNIILLEDQDRNLWQQEYITEGDALVRQALATRRIGAYSLQAAIAAVHAKSRGSTDWDQVIALYSVLLQVEPSPVIELNRAVAIAMRDGPQAGLTIMDNLVERDELHNYHKLHSTRGELLNRLGNTSAAIVAFEQALSMVKQAPEQRYLKQKLTQLKSH